MFELFCWIKRSVISFRSILVPLQSGRKLFFHWDIFPFTCDSFNGKYHHLLMFAMIWIYLFFQINLLTSVLNDAPILPEDVGQDSLKILKDGPQCVAFGIFIIWWISNALKNLINYTCFKVLQYYLKPWPYLSQWSECIKWDRTSTIMSSCTGRKIQVYGLSTDY